MFDLAIDSKLRGCDIVKIKIGDIVLGGRVRPRAIVVQQKTKRPVQFELLDHAQASLNACLGAEEARCSASITVRQRVNQDEIRRCAVS